MVTHPGEEIDGRGAIDLVHGFDVGLGEVHDTAERSTVRMVPDASRASSRSVRAAWDVPAVGVTHQAKTSYPERAGVRAVRAPVPVAAR